MPSLKRELNLWAVVLTSVGIILGAGIYVLIGEAATLSGNLLWLSFVIASIVAALTGLSFAELTSIFPRAGAAHYYTQKGFGYKAAFLVGWLVLAGGVVSIAVVSLGFGNYFNALFGFPILSVALGLVFLTAIILISGVKQSAWLGAFFALIETGGLIAIILVGLPHVGEVNLLEMSNLGIGGVLSAAAVVFFAYIGFQEVAPLAEETKNPTKVMPKAIIYSLIITTIIYVLVAITAVSVLGWETLGASGAPIADVASTAIGSSAFFVFSVIALFATANTVLLSAMTASRILYGMSDTGNLPPIFSKVSAKFRTPWVAILTIGLLSSMFVLVEDMLVVTEITNFTIFVTFIFVNLSLIVLRYKYSEIDRPFKVPLSIKKFPILPALAILLTFAMMFSIKLNVLLVGLAIASLGFVIGCLFKRFNLPSKEVRLPSKLIK